MQQNGIGRIPTSTIIAANGVALAHNGDRVDGFIQNLSTDKLYFKFGSGCSAADFSGILVGGAAQDDGYGASQPIGKYIGVISIYSAGTVRAVVTEIVE